MWGFHDPSGRFSFHFHRVYGPPDELDRRGPVAVLDEERSYWAVSWTTLTATGDERPTEASISYAQARAQPGARRLTFSSFSSPSEMRAKLPVLLHVAEASHPTG